MPEANLYLPTVAWRTLISNVILLTAETEEDVATYRVSIDPIDINEPGGLTGEVDDIDGNNYYLKDFLGHTYKIIAKGTGTVDVSDDFRTGHGAVTGRMGVIYKSVGDGTSPYLAPVYYKYLDSSARDYSRRFELDILWKNAGIAEVITDLSVTGDGTANAPITLVNDEESPGNSEYYGTNASGAKGYHALPEGGGGIDDVYVEPDPTFPIDYLYYEKDSVPVYVTDIPKADGVVAGGHISWLGGLQFQIDPTAWYKAGDLYTILTSTATCDPADPSLPRIDVLSLNTDEQFIVVKGTPSANPYKPTVDPLTQIELTEVYIAAGATEPDPVPTNEIVYNENVEWAVTASGVVVNPDDTTEHYQGSKSIKVGSIGNYDYIQFKAGSGDTFNVEDWENIIANLKLKANLDTRKSRLAVVFLLNGVAINNPTNFDITGNTTNWQNLALPFSRINFFGTEFNQIRFYFYKTTGGAITGFYLDYIKLEIGIEQPVLNQSVILTGDVIGNGVTGVPIPTALKVVNANIGTYGDGTHVARITVDAKGRVTAVSEIVITPGMSEVETAGSVVGVGDLSDPVTLDGDEDDPGPSMYYGTDDSSVPVKGFHPLPEPGGAITTDGSVVGTGDASDPVMLDGDEESPGNSQYYGTNASGAKGYHALPEGGGGIDIGDWDEDIAFDFNDVEEGVAQTWILDIKASFAYKILSVVLQSDSTMDDVTVEIAGSPITWADDSVSIDVTASVVETAAKTDVDNDVAVGEQVTLVKSATDGDPTVIRGKLKIQRT